MITYVEEKQKPEKVLRETKFLPKLVLRIETFNKYVIALGKKTKIDFTSHLTVGRVRYFRIQHLQDALDKTMQDYDQSEVDESNLEEQEVDESISDAESNSVEMSGTCSRASSSTSNSNVGNDAGFTEEKLLRNMKHINKKAKRVQKPSTKEKGAPPTKRRKK